MRTIIVVIFTLLAFSESIAQLGWILQNSRTTNNLNSISTFDGINAVAIGDKGTVTTTGNEGRPSWNGQQNITKSRLFGVTSISARILLAVGGRDTVYRSIDRGVTWAAIRSKVRGECWTIDNISRLTSIDFDSSSGLAVAVGDGREAIFSEDSGTYWEERLPIMQPGSDVSNLRCVSLCKGNVLASGTPLALSSNTSQYMLTTNQGDDWLVNTTDAQGLGSVIGATFFGCDLKTWILVGSNGVILHSKNHGLTWDLILSGTTVNLNAVRFAPDSLYGYIAGDSGVILMSNDGGYNWSREYPPTKHNLRGVALVDPFHVYICGDSGTILWTQDGGFSGIRPSSNEVATDIRTYPNPVSSKTTLQIFLAQRRHVTISVFNVLGAKIATVADDVYAEGPHNFEWNASDMPEGVYFCRLESEGQHFFSQIIVAR